MFSSLKMEPMLQNAAVRPALPLRAGVGLKSAHYGEVFETRPDIGFFEVHAENYMVEGDPLPPLPIPYT